MPERRRIEPWPFYLAGMLLAMIAGSLTFLAIARAHPDPLVVDDPYLAGLRFNEERAAQQRAEALGVSLELTTRADAEGVEVRALLRDPSGALRPPQHLVLRRERPAEGGLDADFLLERAAGAEAGAYRGHVPLPRPGRWRLVARAELGDEVLERSLKLWR